MASQQAIRNVRGASQEITSASVKNDTNGAQIQFLDNHDWNGKVKGGSYPATVAQGANLVFEHDGDSSGLDKAAVVFSASNIPASTNMNCAFLVAWSANSSTAVNQIYVKTGAITDFLNIDWDDIEANLDASTAISTAVDQATKCKAVASITKTGNKAVISGDFTNLN